ncbi:MAG: N-acetylmuramic acid 6-phosphate etherase [Nitrospirae bacterium RBG_16_64_22]|nr:MAG: N-acetylmuramic acid 6-phosphate etherase [Nitrospirae bacterium RBG_16_64_22]
MSVRGILRLMDAEDAKAVRAVARESAAVERAIRAAVKAFQAGGRLIYAGAGTSGRLGVLDASECPPTFSVPHTMVQGIMAGGRAALVRSKEGAEDRPEDGARAIRAKRVGPKDMVLGITAVGMTPFVVGALKEAKRGGAAVWLLTCNREAKRPPYADGIIRSVTGPEVLTGSTRLKAGTATKLVLNRITTVSMVLLGKVYGNLMVDVAPNSRKLVARGKRIVQEATGLPPGEAARLYARSGGNPKAAIVMVGAGCSRVEAKRLLERHEGRIREAMKERNR